MKTKEYLDAAKTATSSGSDYALSKRLGITRGALAEVRAGKRGLPLDAAYKLAIILEADPAQVVADLEAEREKNPAKAEFWRSFLARAASVAVLACTLVLSSSAMHGSAPGGDGSGRRWRFA